MKFLSTGIVGAAIAIGALSMMWWAWRARSGRDQALVPTGAPLVGEPKHTFERVLYVATTRAGHPLERVAIPGLTYRGYCTLQVFAEGVRVQVDGEPAVDIGSGRIEGAGHAQMRIDKVVERDGLAILTWNSGETVLESSFRFSDGDSHANFTSSINEIASVSAPRTDAQQEQA